MIAVAVVCYLLILGWWFLDGWDRMDDPPPPNDWRAAP